jgi:hypothetical protein
LPSPSLLRMVSSRDAIDVIRVVARHIWP